MNKNASCEDHIHQFVCDLLLVAKPFGRFSWNSVWEPFKILQKVVKHTLVLWKLAKWQCILHRGINEFLRVPSTFLAWFGWNYIWRISTQCIWAVMTIDVVKAILLLNGINENLPIFATFCVWLGYQYGRYPQKFIEQLWVLRKLAL